MKWGNITHPKSLPAALALLALSWIVSRFLRSPREDRLDEKVR